MQPFSVPDGEPTAARAGSSALQPLPLAPGDGAGALGFQEPYIGLGMTMKRSPNGRSASSPPLRQAWSPAGKSLMLSPTYISTASGPSPGAAVPCSTACQRDDLSLEPPSARGISRS